MAYTKTAIANQALVRIGEKAIADIDDTTEPASQLRILLDSVSREIQSSFEWNELNELMSLTTLPELTADGLYQYPLPSDTFRVLRINPGVRIYKEWVLRKNLLVTNQISPITVELVRYNADPAGWSIHLSRAIYTELAAQAAQILTQNTGLASRVREEANAALAEAKRLESVANSKSKQMPRGTWRDTRWGRFW